MSQPAASAIAEKAVADASKREMAAPAAAEWQLALFAYVAMAESAADMVASPCEVQSPLSLLCEPL